LPSFGIALGRWAGLKAHPNACETVIHSQKPNLVEAPPCLEHPQRIIGRSRCMKPRQKNCELSRKNASKSVSCRKLMRQSRCANIATRSRPYATEPPNCGRSGEPAKLRKRFSLRPFGRSPQHPMATWGSCGLRCCDRRGDVVAATASREISRVTL
jgi:hypothetical protein